MPNYTESSPEMTPTLMTSGSGLVALVTALAAAVTSAALLWSMMTRPAEIVVAVSGADASAMVSLVLEPLMRVLVTLAQLIW